MKRKYTVILITLILTLIVLSVETVIVRTASMYEAKADAVFAAKDIANGEIISENMLEIREVPVNMLNKNACRDIDKLVGLNTLTDITKGEIIQNNRIGQLDVMESIPVDSNNNRLMTVEFAADKANGWYIKVGQKVDIIYVPRRSESESGTRVEQLENIKVAAIVTDTGLLCKNDKREGLSPKYVSFEVTPTQSQLLAYWKTNGTIELSIIPED